MEALRAKVAAFIEGRDLPADKDGDHRAESQVGGQASLSEELRKGESAEEGIPPSVPISAALPHGHGRGLVGTTDGNPAPSLKLAPNVGADSSAGDTLSAEAMQFGLSPVSTASSLPYYGTVGANRHRHRQCPRELMSQQGIAERARPAASLARFMRCEADAL